MNRPGPTKVCRCGAEIRMMRVHPAGSLMPFNAKPMMIVVFESELARVRNAGTDGQRHHPTLPHPTEWGRVVQAWQPHWASCPLSRQYRGAASLARPAEKESPP